jgi:acyl-coenzyme A thioesterase PaaI-like protein
MERPGPASPPATPEPDAIVLLDDPDNLCFGCSPHNPHGLRLVWRDVGDVVEAHYTAAPHLCGAPGVIHGGIQAVLLDETLGVAIQRSFRDGERRYVVTAAFDLEYRRPAPTGVQLVLRGRLDRCEGRSFFVSGEIADREGRLLTRATARWVEIEAPRDGSR